MPIATASRPAPVKNIRGRVNGVATIQAIEGDDLRRLVARAGVDLPKFVRWNDMKKSDPVIPGQIYFLGKKRLKGSDDFHKVSPGESLWTVSQRYGVQLKRLKRYNRLESDIDPATGTMLFLASRRPKEDAVLAKVENPVLVSNDESFNWAVNTASPEAETISSPPVVTTPEDRIEPAPAGEEPVKPEDSDKILQSSETPETLEDGPKEVLAIPADKQHTVKAGETLYAIARLYDVKVMDIVTLNNLDLQLGIKPGQVLKLSGEQPDDHQRVVGNEETARATTYFHEVKTSDTLYGIARQYNVTIKQIMEWNEKKDFSLAVGEKLKIMRGQ